MDIDKLTKLLEVILSWPVIILFVVIYLGSSIKNFINNLRRFSAKGPQGFEVTATVEVEQIRKEAAGYLGAALTTVSDETFTDGQVLREGQVSVGEVRGIAKAVSQEITLDSLRTLSGASVLWVDDHPSKNFYKRKALELLGIHFTISTSTKDALEKVSKHKYDVIISDMEHPFEGTAISSPPSEWTISSPPEEWAASSPPEEWAVSSLIDRQGAYTLLEELQRRDIDTPFIIHSSSSSEKKAEARRRGAFGFTGNPETLFRMVIDAIRGTTAQK